MLIIVIAGSLVVIWLLLSWLSETSLKKTKGAYSYGYENLNYQVISMLCPGDVAEKVAKYYSVSDYSKVVDYTIYQDFQYADEYELAMEYKDEDEFEGNDIEIVNSSLESAGTTFRISDGKWLRYEFSVKASYQGEEIIDTVFEVESCLVKSGVTWYVLSDNCFMRLNSEVLDGISLKALISQ